MNLLYPFTCALLISHITQSLTADCEKLGTSKNDTFFTKGELENCVATVGRNSIDKSIAENIWRAIKQVYGGVDGIPLQIYKNMGWTLSGISKYDLNSMTFDQGEFIQIFGSSESINDEQLDIIAQKVKAEWANKTPEKYSEYDLKILGKILCHFNQTEIIRIHADAYRGAAGTIGKLNSCPHVIIESLAKLAVQQNAFGPPSTWSKLDISEIGIVIGGLSDNEFNLINQENLMQNRRLYNQVYSNRTPAKDSMKSKPNSSKNNTANEATTSGVGGRVNLR